MSYFQYGLGADPAPPACPAGFVYAEGQCALAPAPGIPPEMVGRAPGGYVWQNGAWRRAKVGETGVLPNGIQVRVTVAPGVKQTFAEQGGQLVSTGVSLDPIAQECVAAGVPEALLKTCYESVGPEKMKNGQWKSPPFAQFWKECAASGMPVELVPNCVQARQAGTPLAEVVKQLQEALASGQLQLPGGQADQPPPGPGLLSGRNLLILGGVAALGLVIYLRRKQ